MDSVGLEVDVLLEDGDLPPLTPNESDPPRDPSASPPSKGSVNLHLVTFVVVLFGALELQALMVLMGAADGGGAEAMTWAFGGIFLLSVFAWFVGGMWWFNHMWERDR